MSPDARLPTLFTELPVMTPRNVPTLSLPRLVPLVVALGLSACSMVPTYQRPERAVPQQLPATDATAAAEAASAPAAQGTPTWRAFFPDERLRGLIERALEGNRDLRVAVRNVDQLRAAYQVADADRLPTLNGTVSSTRGPTAFPPFALTTIVQAGVTVASYELDLFGRVRALSEAAAAQLLASESGRQAAQVSLVAAVANAYYSLWADRWQLALTAETLRTRQASLQLLQLKHDSGVLNELDLRAGQSLVEAAKVSQAQAQRQWALDLNALQLLLGQSVPAELLPPVVDAQALLAPSTVATRPAAVGVAPAAVQLWPELPALPSDLSSEVLLQRPDIAQAEQSLIAANANVGVARAARFPRISLTASAGVISNSLDELFGANRQGWSVAPSMTVPLLDWGRASANVDAAIARKDAAVASYDKAVQTAFREVADALVARSTWIAQARAQAAQAEAEGQRLRLSTLRYDSGVASQLDLLDAQRSWFTAQQGVIVAQLSRQQAQIGLFKALGGGAIN